jgi:hypothetical protein
MGAQSNSDAYYGSQNCQGRHNARAFWCGRLSFFLEHGIELSYLCNCRYYNANGCIRLQNMMNLGIDDMSERLLQSGVRKRSEHLACRGNRDAAGGGNRRHQIRHRLSENMPLRVRNNDRIRSTRARGALNMAAQLN